MSFDLSKCPRNEQGHYLCRTRNGKNVRIVCTDMKFMTSGQHSPLLGLIDGEMEYCKSWKIDGRECCSGDSVHDHDLENIPTKVKRWVNIFDHSVLANAFTTEAEARGSSIARHAIAIAIPVEFEVKL